jgi:nucleotide-binding universal stress UspA family protein
VNPFERILVPVAPTPAGDRALTVALELVHRTGVPLLLLSVARPITDEVAARLAAFRSGAHRTDVEARVVGYGSIARAITAAAEPGTLVCMSSHGAYGPARTLTGSVTEEVLRSAEEPVLVVGPRVPGCLAWRRARRRLPRQIPPLGTDPGAGTTVVPGVRAATVARAGQPAGQPGGRADQAG